MEEYPTRLQVVRMFAPQAVAIGSQGDLKAAILHIHGIRVVVMPTQPPATRYARVGEGGRIRRLMLLPILPAGLPGVVAGVSEMKKW